jgi:hypothetical protein
MKKTDEELNEEMLKKEKEDFLLVCGSCLYYRYYLATMGFCKIKQGSNICAIPNGVVDLFDEKCDKWLINPENL